MNPFAPKPPAKRKKRPRVSVKMEHPQHGKIEIHSMRGVMHGEPCMLLADAAGASPKSPVWIQIAKQGQFLGHSAGPFEMSSKTFEEIIQNFKAHPEHIPIDFEHASEAPAHEGSIPHTGAPAQGWIVDMKIDAGGNLVGLVEWGELARDYIQKGQYKYFSPAIRFGAKDRVTGKTIGARMTSGALTNSPFLSGMQKVAAKDVDELEEDELEEENELPAPAGDQPADTEAQVEIEKKLKDTEDRLAVMADKATLADTKAKDAEKLVTAKDAEVTTLREENKGLLAWKTEREEADNKAEVDIAFETYKDQRKLSDAMKEPMLAMLKAAPSAFRTMYPVVKQSQRHLLRNVTVEREVIRDEEKDALPHGADAVVVLSDRLRKENPKMTHFDALVAADKQLRAASRR